MSRRIKLDRLLVVDLEMTCWDGAPPPGQVPEIIQIGVVEIDTSVLSIVRSDEYSVKPQHSLISEYCTKLTGITPQANKKACRPFPEVANTIRKRFGPADKVWCAWGRDDLALADAQTAHRSLPVFPGQFLNLSLFISLISPEKRRIGVTDALALFGRDFEGRPHGALADALNTARIAMIILDAIRNGLAIS